LHFKAVFNRSSGKVEIRASFQEQLSKPIRSCWPQDLGQPNSPASLRIERVVGGAKLMPNLSRASLIDAESQVGFSDQRAKPLHSDLALRARVSTLD
jgi:hypothetical protein